MSRAQLLTLAAALALGLGTLTMLPQSGYAADAGESHGSNGGGYDGHAHNGCECGGPGNGGTKYKSANPTKGKPKGNFRDLSGNNNGPGTGTGRANDMNDERS